MYSIFVLPSKLVHGLLSWRGANVTSLLVLFLGCQLHSWYGFERSLTRFLPPTRPFIPLVPLNIEGSGDSTGGGTIDSLPVSIPAASTQAEEFFVHGELKVLQFNMLADGLSGQRPDLGAFSRVQPQDMTWQSRRDKLLYEVLQYDPDVITLQECDHYYDFFLPQLQSRGFDGVFAPKPASACLQYSNSSDGLAMFYRRDKLSMLSVEVNALLLSSSC